MLCNTFRTAASLAMAGLGLAYVPEALYREEFASGRLRRLVCDPENRPLKIFSIRSLANWTPAQRVLEALAQQIVAGRIEAERSAASPEQRDPDFGLASQSVGNASAE